MEKKLRHKGEVINPLVQSGDKSRALVGFKVMRIIHKCRRQGSGSLSLKGLARALTPSQSYRKDHLRTRTGFRTEFILEQASPEAT